MALALHHHHVLTEGVTLKTSKGVKTMIGLLKSHDWCINVLIRRISCTVKYGKVLYGNFLTS